MKIFKRKLPDFQIACKKFSGTSINPAKLENRWKEVLQWGKEMGLLEEMHNTGIYGIGICRGNPDGTDTEGWQYYAGIVVDNDLRDENGMEIQEIFGGNYITVKHTGPYENIRKTYDRILNDWMPSKDIFPASDVYIEIFRTNPGNLSTESCDVDVCIPYMEEE